MQKLVVIAHDIRSTHNVGALLRTAEGLGVDTVYFTGYTPYPSQPDDTRLPHIHQKLTKQINKTALGAEQSQKWEAHTDIHALITQLKSKGFQLAALEQAPHSIALHKFTPQGPIALLIGREVEGIEQELLDKMDTILEISMYGTKESFNVVQATAMALFQMRFH